MYNRYKKQLALATEEEYYLEAEMRLSADNRPGFDSQIVTLRYIVLVAYREVLVESVRIALSRSVVIGKTSSPYFKFDS